MEGILKGKIIFMTGATSGLGKTSALKAAADGAAIVALVRDKTKGQKLLDDFQNQYPQSTGKIEIVEGDLSSFQSVSEACHEVLKKYPVIDMIVNNAGMMNFKPRLSADMIEETLQVNLLSPLLICHLLFNSLKKSKNGRIIFTSSGLHKGEIHFDNLEFKGNFSSFKVYSQSKLGVILICRLIADSLKEYDIGIYSQHPGLVRTELGRSAGWFSRMIFNLMGSSPEKGSETLSFLIDADNSDLKSGEYYTGKKIKQTTRQSYDMVAAEKLMKTAYRYLDQYIESESPVFPAQVQGIHNTDGLL
jgi:NAD(P)-dependent dehydrogenase (short-subunit alcohol dehydrogenase family)